MQAQNLLGEPLWRPPAPNGFADDNATWLDGLSQRLDLANQFARRIAGDGRSDGGVRADARADRVGRYAPHHHARREPPAGAGAAADVTRISEEMTMSLHAPTRRELLLASGTLFAWAYLPKLALAEGRDPRLLAIVLRGALDGLAAVAPVGDPNWVKLRGDKALTLDGDDAGAAARRHVRAQSGDAEPASPLQGRRRDHRACGGDALSRALAFRRPGRARKRPRASGRGVDRLAQPRAGDARAGGARQSEGAQCLRGRADCAAGRARRRRRCCHGRRRGCRRPATTP